MSYVHLGFVGTLSPQEQATRDQIAEVAFDVVEQWRGMIDELLTGRFSIIRIAATGATPLWSRFITLPTIRTQLQTAKSQLTRVREAILSVVFDESLSIQQVQQRLDDFVDSYGKNLSAQLKNSMQAADRASLSGLFVQVEKAFETVTRNFSDKIGKLIGLLLEMLGRAVAAGIGELGLGTILLLAAAGGLLVASRR